MGRLFLEADERCLHLFGRIAQAGIANASGLKTMTTNYQRALNVAAAMKLLSGNLSTKHLLKDIMIAVKKMINADDVHIFLTEETTHTTRELKFAATTSKSRSNHAIKIKLDRQHTTWTKKTIDKTGMKTWGLTGHACIMNDVVHLEGKQWITLVILKS